MFLGYKIDQHGIHPIDPTPDAITRTKVPSDVTELRSFIGVVNHYGRTVYKTNTSTQCVMFSRVVAHGETSELCIFKHQEDVVLFSNCGSFLFITTSSYERCFRVWYRGSAITYHN